MDQGLNRQTVLMYNDVQDGSPSIENVSESWDTQLKDTRRYSNDLTKRLTEAGLFEHEIKILTLRFVMDMTFEEINKEMCLSDDARHTYYYYKKALNRYKQYLTKKGKKYA